MTKQCTLCELPVENADFENKSGNVFCCKGCQQIHETLPEVAEIEASDIQSTVDSSETPDDDTPADGFERTFLEVQGMYCVTCEAFIETLATTDESIDSASANYVTETVRVDYDPESITETDIRDQLTGYGYTAYPREDPIRKQQLDNRAFVRLAVGVLVGMMVMFQYLVIIYPTYFGGLFYDERTAEFLAAQMGAAGGGYFFVVIGVLTSIVLFYTGMPLLRGAWVSLRMRSPNMDLLVSLAAMSAYVYSTVAFLTGGQHIYYDVTVAIIVIVTIGKYYESSIKDEATALLSDLTSVQVNEARYLPDFPQSERTETIPLEQLEGGTHILVRAGERIPVDGMVIDGQGITDESIITGESLPVSKSDASTVVGGSILLDGALIIEVNEGANSSIDRISNLVWNLQSSESGIQKLADKLAVIFVPVVLILAILVSAMYIYLGGSMQSAVLVGLTVLIVSCPCALGLATPLAVASSIREALERHIVIFDDTVFERIRDADTLILDKTGTLTTGNMRVKSTDVTDALLNKAAKLEQRSAHPVAKAIVEAYGPTADGGRPLYDHSQSNSSSHSEVVEEENDSSIPENNLPSATASSVRNFSSHAKGVSGDVDGISVAIGHPDYFDELKWDVPKSVMDTLASARRDGHVPVAVGKEGKASGVVVLEDSTRDSMEEMLDWFDGKGVDIVILTGDDESATATFKSNPKISTVFAGVPPEAKVETVRRYASDGITVMVGDGTNDAPALAAADLGIALGSGTAMAADAADIALIDDDLASLTEVFQLAAAANRRVKTNIGWAFCYNAIAIPLAITGLLNPLFAAVAMATSSILVVTNSSRSLLKKEP